MPHAEVERLIEVMHTLRQKCPWDAEQTHESLMPYLVEETLEVVEAVEDGSDDCRRETVRWGESHGDRPRPLWSAADSAALDRLARCGELARRDAEEQLVAMPGAQQLRDHGRNDKGENSEQQRPHVGVVHPANLRLDRVSDLTTTVVVRVEHVSDSRSEKVRGAFRERDAET